MKIKFNKVQKTFFLIIAILCFLAIGIAVYIQVQENDYKVAVKNTNNDNNESYEELKNNFNNIFEYTIIGNKDDINVKKINNNKDFVYTSAVKEENIEEKYEVNVQIPKINIDSEYAEKCNKEIVEIFQSKTVNILTEVKEYTIYSVKYQSYIYSNILSLVIQSTLKEGNNPQRVILKTYNIDLSTLESVSIDNIIELNKINKKNIQNKINEEIKNQDNYEDTLRQLGYEVYDRDTNSEIYKIENISNFFLDENGKLYIIFAYGNSKYTSEMDLVII